MPATSSAAASASSTASAQMASSGTDLVRVEVRTTPFCLTPGPLLDVSAVVVTPKCHNDNAETVETRFGAA
jgi:hypothetical protein